MLLRPWLLWPGALPLEEAAVRLTTAVAEGSAWGIHWTLLWTKQEDLARLFGPESGTYQLLVVALRCGHEAVALAIIGHRAASPSFLDAPDGTARGQTALALAAEYDVPRALKALLARGVATNEQLRAAYSEACRAKKPAAANAIARHHRRGGATLRAGWGVRWPTRGELLEILLSTLCFYMLALLLGAAGRAAGWLPWPTSFAEAAAPFIARAAAVVTLALAVGGCIERFTPPHTCDCCGGTECERASGGTTTLVSQAFLFALALLIVIVLGSFEVVKWLVLTWLEGAKWLVTMWWGWAWMWVEGKENAKAE